MQELHARHERRFASYRFVYPVLSRRAGGLSIGINLNPDKGCNFDCTYCQVDRRQPPAERFVELPILLDELDSMMGLVLSGRIFQTEKFSATPEAQRRLRDMAFSGDGEPTTYGNLPAIVQSCAAIKRQYRAAATKMVLITNASMLHRQHVQDALDTLDANQGEIWAKLDAGTEDYYRMIARTRIPFQRILDNIALAARRRPIVIQTLLMRIDGQPPGESEIAAYIQRLRELSQDGRQLKLIQIYTIARQPAESNVSPLSNEQLDQVVDQVRSATRLNVAGFHGHVVADAP